MERRFVVLDTNCLVQSLSRRSKYYSVWENFISGNYYLCVTTEILAEYEEIIARLMSPLAAQLAIETILRANNVVRVDAQYRFHMIEADVDDNKFVDCAIISNADYIVTQDKHFNVLKDISFPHVDVKSLEQFIEDLVKS
ncbi:MAG: putative toxin-antitoxin system toxin component, PIN family [Muribaculaceae bacterium]|nr:putative toxin-antitoxin system toxin component, PIN family [Muribaculaceae bacterium]